MRDKASVARHIELNKLFMADLQRLIPLDTSLDEDQVPLPFQIPEKINCVAFIMNLNTQFTSAAPGVMLHVGIPSCLARGTRSASHATSSCSYVLKLHGGRNAS